MKNLTIIVLACFAATFAVQSHKNGYQKQILMQSNRELSEENYNLRVILDSIDNPHHHDYLCTLSAYHAVKK